VMKYDRHENVSFRIAHKTCLIQSIFQILITY
jgi:hypothetical protein